MVIAWSVAQRIDPTAAAIDGLGPKPPRMRWRTYERLGERHARQMGRWARNSSRSYGKTATNDGREYAHSREISRPFYSLWGNAHA